MRPVTIEGVSTASIQGDKAFTEVIQAMGGNVDMGQHQMTVTGFGHIKGIEQDFNAIPDARDGCSVSVICRQTRPLFATLLTGV